MRRHFIIAAAILSASFGLSIATAQAATIAKPVITADSESLVHNVSSSNLRVYLRSGHAYIGHHRGYRHKRHGYRYYRGYYFPHAAFVIQFGRPHYRVEKRYVAPRRYQPRIIHLSDAHYRYCHGRYKTYRASDNTYAYKVGHRTYCRSPYSH